MTKPTPREFLLTKILETRKLIQLTHLDDTVALKILQAKLQGLEMQLTEVDNASN